MVSENTPTKYRIKEECSEAEKGSSLFHTPSDLGIKKTNNQSK